MPVGKKVSFNSQIAMGLSDNNKPFTDHYYIGGYRYNQRAKQVAFVGLHGHELLQDNYLKAKFGVQVQPIPNLFLSGLPGNQGR